MALKAALLTRLLHSRGTAVVMAVLAFVVFCVCYNAGGMELPDVDKGVALPSADEWLPAGLPDFTAAMACYVLSVVLMITICRIFNVLRSLTWLQVAFFALMQCATPDLAVQFYTGSMLLPVVQLCLLLILGTYREPQAAGNVFLIFALLSFFTATQYCYAVYMLVFLLAAVQMRVFDGRTFTAALLGIATPWWILFGFGILTPADIHLPSPAGIFSVIDLNDTLLLVLTVAFTALLIVLSLVLNVFRTIAYNARARAVNGVFTVLSLTTLVACCVDFSNLVCYIPLLNFCAALQTAHYFATHRAEKSCIAIMLIMAAYIALFICQRTI